MNNKSKKKKSTVNKKAKKKEDLSTPEDSDAMSFQESDNDILTVQDLLEYSKLSEESELEDEVGKVPFYKIKINHTHVIVEYEQEYFPGLVKQRKGQRLEVSTMNMCAGVNGLNWKWPEVEDKIWYFKSQIEEIIQPPQLVSATSSRLSGVYFVPEMEKYKKNNM